MGRRGRSRGVTQAQTVEAGERGSIHGVTCLGLTQTRQHEMGTEWGVGLHTCEAFTGVWNRRQNFPSAVSLKLRGGN